MPDTAAHRAGFSLVELSIVMAIIGLLAGGVMVGKSMIRSSQVRAVVTEYERYTTASQAFENKYNALAGDMANATTYWGDNNSKCADPAITDGNPGTCNGNADGILNAGTAINTTTESFQFWNQLALAGFIAGKYTGITGSNGTYWVGNDAIIGTNVPASRMTGAGWAAFYYYDTFAGDSVLYSGIYRNVLIFGAEIRGNYNIATQLRPDEAKSIDDKLDDGYPGTGIMVTREGNGFGTAGVDLCTTSANADDKPGAYNLSGNARVCGPWFPNAL